MLHCPTTLGNNINIIKSKFADLIGNICDFNKIVEAFFFFLWKAPSNTAKHREMTYQEKTKNICVDFF